MSEAPKRDFSLDYLRATLTVLVVAHHSSLAYTTFAASDPGNYRGGTAPIVDTARWKLLDHAENFNDVFFMSAMFFISGLFVWNSLKRHGAGGFLRDRLVRLGIPFLLGLVFLMPLAYYAAWLFAGGTAGYLEYWKANLLTDGFTPGPLWFIWVLLLFDAALAGIYMVAPRLGERLGWLAGFGERRPLLLVCLILLLCAAAYFPALAVYGPSAWAQLITGPFYYQSSRFALYFIWFLIGCSVGAIGLHRGLLNRHASMTRHAARWLAGAVLIYFVMEFMPRVLFDAGALAETQARTLYDLLWLVACVALTLGFVAVFRRYAVQRSAIMDMLTRSAYGVYIVHYLFVLWIQFALLNFPLDAGIKFLVTFGGALALSVGSALLLLRVPGVRAIL